MEQADPLLQLSQFKHFTSSPEAVFGYAESQLPAFQHALAEAFWVEPGPKYSAAIRAIEATPSRWEVACELFERSRGVVSTNFDPVAWEVARAVQDKTGMPWRLYICDAARGVNHEAFAALVAPDNFKPLILLHGGLHDPVTQDWPQLHSDAMTRVGNLVLSDKSYARAYFYPSTRRGLELSRADFVRKLYTQLPLLFLGFSLSDTLINLCMSQARLASKRSVIKQHFAILNGRTEQVGSAVFLTGDHPPDCVVGFYEEVYKIRPIFLDARRETAANLTVTLAMDRLWEELRASKDEVLAEEIAALVADLRSKNTEGGVAN